MNLESHEVLQEIVDRQLLYIQELKSLLKRHLDRDAELCANDEYDELIADTKKALNIED